MPNYALSDPCESHSFNVKPGMIQQFFSRRPLIKGLLEATDQEISASICDLHVRIKKKWLIDHTIGDGIDSFAICTGWEEGVFIVDHIVGDYTQ